MVKQEVLAALDAARGRYISGQELADQLGVSRAAIWKAVTALRADGTPIEAITNRGYALPHGADLLNADAITALLAPAVAQAVQITVVDRLPGTNAALRTQATNGAPEGLVLIAQAQSAGRGRRGHDRGASGRGFRREQRHHRGKGRLHRRQHQPRDRRHECREDRLSG